MKKEKRVLKGYKIRKSVYDKAMKRAAKNKMPLATTVESWVSCYADGISVGPIGNIVPANS